MSAPEPHEPKPGGLGAYEPEPGSVTWRSHWRVDPRRAARWYGLALVLGAALAGWLTTWVASVDEAPDRVAYLLRAKQGIVPTVATVFGVVLLLGTTKRCFGFGRASVAAAALTASALALFAHVATPTWAPATAGAVLALVFVVMRAERRRRGAAMVGFLALAHLAWRLSLLAYDLEPPRGDEVQVLRGAWFALGAAPTAALVLWSTARAAD